MSIQKRPSPERQGILYSSHLQGMERPVRSFKSFIRVTPPHTRPNKPLPPIPTLQKTSSSSSVATVQSISRSTGFSLWESPSNWDNGEGSQTQSSHSFALRHYSPLIPEPPEDIAAMQMDPTLWQRGNGSFPQTQLHPINERTTATPEIPARNPSRLSLSLSNPALAREFSKTTPPTISSRCSIITPDEELVGGIFATGPQGQASNDLASPLELASALLDETMKEKAARSLAPETLQEQHILRGNQPQRSDSLQLEDDVNLDLHGNKLKTFRKGSVLVSDSPISPEGPELDEKMQALSFAQDYHNVLVGQYQDDHDQFGDDCPPRTPPKDGDLTPRPLAWRKGSGGLSAAASHRPQMTPSSSSGRHNNLEKLSSWVNHRLRRDSQPGLHQGSTSSSKVSSNTHSESDIHRSLKRDARLADIIQHGKDLISRKMLRKDSEPRRPMIISSPIPQHPIYPPSASPLSEAPFQLATPLFRLPGGLALVRNPPPSTHRPHISSGSPTSPTSPYTDRSWPDFPATSPFRFDFSRRSSWQSAASQPQQQSNGAPDNVVKTRFRDFIPAPSSQRSLSCTSASYAAPPLQDPVVSFTPPSPRRRSHNINSPLRSSDAAEGHDEQKRNLFEKAVHAREAWRMHRRDLKKERLKQSIRLIGPADASSVAGYIECGERGSGDSGIGEGGLAGYVVNKAS